MKTLSRRELAKLLTFSGVGLAAQQVLSPLELLAQSAQTAGYRALVCITLDGGCDSNNMVVPLQPDQYASYQAARPNLAILQNSLLPFKTSTGAQFGFHPSLPTISSMYNSGHCAVIANVGPLREPMTLQAAQANPGLLPTNLENHQLQRIEWATCAMDTSAVATTQPGWGGRIADFLQSSSSGVFPIVTGFGTNQERAFCYGSTSVPAMITPGGSVFSSQASKSLQMLTQTSSGSTFISAAVNGMKAAYQQNAALESALQSAPTFQTQFPNTSLGAQLQQTAQMIAVRSALGLNRQIFMVEHDGFDTHETQELTESSVLGQFDAGVAAFQSALSELGMSDDVLVFTTTDFNRSLLQNSTFGSDHAWGGHALVVGTSIKRSNIYGTFPQLTIGGPDDFMGNGVWLPTTSVDQYGASLASWMGVPDTSLTSIFPNLNNFTTKKLGFV